MKEMFLQPSYIKSKGNKQSDGTSTIKLYKITKIKKKNADIEKKEEKRYNYMQKENGTEIKNRQNI